jgi:aspartate aminotransferase
MNLIFAKRLAHVQPSATLTISARAQRLQAEGKAIINLSVGEPDFDTPDFVKQAAILAIQQGFTKYTAVEGIASLKQAVIAKLARDNQLSYQPSQIIVCNGAKQAFYNLTQALLNPGDEVVIPVPCWVSYVDMVHLAEASPVIVPGDAANRFKISPDDLQKAITPKTKLVILNSPSNPTGVAYDRAELAALGEVLLKHPKLFVASDDIYEHTLWRGEFCNILMACPALYDRAVVINGVSKTYAMTGWRIGYAAGNEPLIRAMAIVQSQSTSNAASISQYAALSALNGDQSGIQVMINAFKKRHDQALTQLNQVPDLHCVPADGAFYLFLGVEKIIARLPGIDNDVALAEYLLDKAGVAVVPGTAFGFPGFIRISIAVADVLLAKGVGRMVDCLV